MYWQNFSRSGWKELFLTIIHASAVFALAKLSLLAASPLFLWMDCWYIRRLSAVHHQDEFLLMYWGWYISNIKLGTKLFGAKIPYFIYGISVTKKVYGNSTKVSQTQRKVAVCATKDKQGKGEGQPTLLQCEERTLACS